MFYNIDPSPAHKTHYQSFNLEHVQDLQANTLAQDSAYIFQQPAPDASTTQDLSSSSKRNEDHPEDPPSSFPRPQPPSTVKALQFKIKASTLLSSSTSLHNGCSR